VIPKHRVKALEASLTIFCNDKLIVSFITLTTIMSVIVASRKTCFDLLPAVLLLKTCLIVVVFAVQVHCVHCLCLSKVK